MKDGLPFPSKGLFWEAMHDIAQNSTLVSALSVRSEATGSGSGSEIVLDGACCATCNLLRQLQLV